MAPSSGGWILTTQRQLRQMQSALHFDMGPCLTGRQAPHTQRPLSVWPEISDLVKGIVHERDKRIAMQTAARRLPRPCCSMFWVDKYEYGLPPEAELLASVARMEDGPPSAIGRAAVGSQAGLAKEARSLSAGYGQDCGQSPASRPGSGIPERELLLLMAGDGGDEGWSEPSWYAPSDTVHVGECHPPAWGLGPLPSRADEPEHVVSHGHPCSDQQAAVQAEPLPPEGLGFRPLSPVPAEDLCSHPLDL